MENVYVVDVCVKWDEGIDAFLCASTKGCPQHMSACKTHVRQALCMPPGRAAFSIACIARRGDGQFTVHLSKTMFRTSISITDQGQRPPDVDAFLKEHAEDKVQLFVCGFDVPAEATRPVDACLFFDDGFTSVRSWRLQKSEARKRKEAAEALIHLSHMAS